MELENLPKALTIVWKGKRKEEKEACCLACLALPCHLCLALPGPFCMRVSLSLLSPLFLA